MAATIPFSKELKFEYGEPSELSPLIRRVVAQNPSAFTLYGTGTYIIGRGKVAIVDPGPADPDHIEAILKAVEGEEITHILITHTHHDHSPGAALLKARINGPTYGYGPHGGDTNTWKAEEGGDLDFTPDIKVNDGDIIKVDGWSVRAIHTPGHLSNHICFELIEEKTLFSGDHVMGWSTSVVSPPDGNMTDYMTSLEKLFDYDHVRYWPTHGPCIDNPHEFVRGLIQHRQSRMQQIRECLQSGPMTIPEMVRKMYTDVPEHLHPAAARSVYSHILMMVDKGEVASDGDLEVTDIYRLA